MVLASYLGGLINALTHTLGLLKLDFCGPNIVNHFFCDISPLLRLACSDTHENELVLLVFSGVIAMFTFTVVMVSYICIVIAMQRIRSVQGRLKAFSTCASHLSAVTLLYGSVTFSYIQPSSQYSLEQEKVCAVFYTLVIPMLYPLIYSLRNSDVKTAANRLSNLSFCDICFSTVFAPKMLINFLSKRKWSTFYGCVLQSFFFAVYVTTEGILLSVMAYDHYVAIAKPLSYSVLMTQSVCVHMVLASYLGGLINTLTHTLGLLKLDFCGPNVVNHFFCDLPPLLRLACSDAHVNERLLLVFSGVIATFVFIVVIVSYIRIKPSPPVLHT
ncbi:Olfactory receptor 1052 [Fukomys damarensis]|uniref:Olfactory receptor 1052 n=1 Tax=Fukomys damarensis TaxID=885580 RepID=A0A091E3M2_FUKDA|nr:Olfactory receptor 1052 [Fukomys damarensis]